jgi:hypothetical protein
LSVNSVKVESNQAAAARLWRTARSAERLDTNRVRVRKILEILLNLPYQFVYIIPLRC